MRGHVVLSLKQLARNLCEVLENVLRPAVIVSPAVRCWIETVYAVYIVCFKLGVICHVHVYWQVFDGNCQQNEGV